MTDTVIGAVIALLVLPLYVWLIKTVIRHGMVAAWDQLAFPFRAFIERLMNGPRRTDLVELEADIRIPLEQVIADAEAVAVSEAAARVPLPPARLAAPTRRR